jgi:hypothetical protein
LSQTSLPPDLDFAANPAATPDRMNTAMANLHGRLSALETYKPNFDALLAQLQQVGLSRINDALLPIYNELASLANLGTLFSATSASSVPIATGAATFIIDESMRGQFAPAAWIAAQAPDASAAVAGDVVSYDRTTGTLIVNVSYTFGDGTLDSWIISPTAPPQVSVATIDGGAL